VAIQLTSWALAKNYIHFYTGRILPQGFLLVCRLRNFEETYDSLECSKSELQVALFNVKALALNCIYFYTGRILPQDFVALSASKFWGNLQLTRMFKKRVVGGDNDHQTCSALAAHSIGSYTDRIHPQNFARTWPLKNIEEPHNSLWIISGTLKTCDPLWVHWHLPLCR